MATEFCCQIYEKTVVDALSPPYNRLEPKLSPTEKARLTTTLERVWGLIPKYANSSEPSAYDDLNGLSVKDLYLTWETIAFLHDFVGEEDILHAMRLQYDEETIWKSIDGQKGLQALLRIGSKLTEEKNPRGLALPDKRPLGHFAMFDHWHKEYVEDIFDHV
jgi:hypothetical protein